MEPQRIEPHEGQESVWDYPRPPRCEPTTAHVEVEFHGTIIADTVRAVRVLETSQPPAFYLPPDDVAAEFLVASTAQSFCEWKGTAAYVDVVVGEQRVDNAAWRYDHPTARFAALAGYYGFYSQLMTECRVDGEVVHSNEGIFYGGWITSKVVGPFKGGPGTAHW